MRKTIISSLAGAILALSTTTAVHAADLVTKCGSAQLKAYDKWVGVLIKEAGKACGAGFANTPAPVDQGKVLTATVKFKQTLVSTVGSYGQPSCFLAPEDVDIDEAVETTESIALSLCTPS